MQLAAHYHLFLSAACAYAQIYFHPVQRAYRRFQGEVKPARGAEEFKFKSVALEDPGRTMGKAWLRAPPGAQAAEGLSRAFASLNFERGLRGCVAVLPAVLSDL